MTAEGKRDVCRLFAGTAQLDVAGQGASPRPFGSSRQSRGPSGQVSASGRAASSRQGRDGVISTSSATAFTGAASHLGSGGEGRAGFSEMACDYGSRQIFISHNSEGWKPEVTVAAWSGGGLRWAADPSSFPHRAERGASSVGALIRAPVPLMRAPSS